MPGIPIRAAILGVIAWSAMSSPLAAQDDGSFCIGPTFIAYALSSNVAPLEFALHVVSLTDSGGIGRPSTIRLHRFTVHGSRCNPTSVELLGWDSLYVVPVGQPGAAPVARVATWTSQAQRRLPDGFTAASFWIGTPALRAGRPDSLRVPVEAAARRFLLVRTITPNPQNPCLYNLRSEVVESDASGRPLGSLLLVDRERHRECGN